MTEIGCKIYSLTIRRNYYVRWRQYARYDEKSAENAKRYEETVGGGTLTIVMNGEKTVESVTIDPSVIDPEDKEMLEDLIVAAVNEAGKKVDDMMAQEMSKITGGMNLPGMF